MSSDWDWLWALENHPLLTSSGWNNICLQCTGQFCLTCSFTDMICNVSLCHLFCTYIIPNVLGKSHTWRNMCISWSPAWCDIPHVHGSLCLPPNLVIVLCSFKPRHCHFHLMVKISVIEGLYHTLSEKKDRKEISSQPLDTSCPPVQWWHIMDFSQKRNYFICFAVSLGEHLCG